MGSQPVQDEIARDQYINALSREYPEYSELDRQQEEIVKEAEKDGPRSSYPEYEGPGYTEPPVNWSGWHRDHSEYEREHYWDPEYDQDGNPSNERDSDAAQYEHDPRSYTVDPIHALTRDSLPEGPERDAYVRDYEAGTLRTCDDRAAEADAGQYEFSEQEKARIAGGILGDYFATWEPAERAEAVEAIRQDHEAGS